MAHTFIFDLDGTLIDTLSDLAAALRYALVTHSLPERSDEEVRSFIGNGMTLLVKRACPPDTPDDILGSVQAEFMRYYMSHIDVYSRPYAGISELLTSLKENGVNIAVLTNKAQPAAEKLISEFFGNDIPVYGITDDRSRKPDPTLALGISARFGTDPHRAVMIGDSDTDILTAMNAGMRSVTVLWGFRHKDELGLAPSERYAATVPELKEILFEIIKAKP